MFRTDDGGATWTESFRNTDARGLLRLPHLLRQPPRPGDERPGGRQVPHPVHQRRRTLLEGAARATACPRPRRARRASRPSGQCLVSSGPRDVWLATGGAARARVLHSADRGLTWTAADTPDPGGRPGARRLRPRLPRPYPRPRGRRRLPRRPGLPAGGGAHPRRRPHLDARGTAAARLPLRRHLAPAQPHVRARGRPHRHRPDDRRRPHLAHAGHRLVRHRGLHPRPRLLGLRREGPGGTPGTLTRVVCALGSGYSMRERE